jgi:cytochrome c553
MFDPYKINAGGTYGFRIDRRSCNHCGDRRRRVFLGGFTAWQALPGTRDCTLGADQVRRHRSIGTRPTSLHSINDAQTVQAGAAFAAHGCADCHGAPGVPWQKYSEGLHPDPPDLKEVVDHQTPAQLFWVVKNGINMTGMPSFQLAGAKDEEIWAIAAFLKKLPTVSEADYKAWTAPPAAAPPAPPPAAQPAPNPPADNK